MHSAGTFGVHELWLFRPFLYPNNFEGTDKMLELEQFKLEIEALKGDLDEMRASL